MKNYFLIFTSLFFTFFCTTLTTAQEVFISELYVDSGTTGQDEFVEIAAPMTETLTGWQLALYDGQTGTVYDVHTFSAADVLSYADTLNGLPYGLVVKNYGLDGIQNDVPDGMALIDANNEVVQFISYGGTFTATDGPAVGATSRDIGLATSPNGRSSREICLSPNSPVELEYCEELPPSPGTITKLANGTLALKCWECNETSIWSNGKNVGIDDAQPSGNVSLYVRTLNRGTAVAIDGGFTGNNFTGLSIYAPGLNNKAASFRGNVNINDGVTNFNGSDLVIKNGDISVLGGKTSLNNTELIVQGGAVSLFDGKMNLENTDLIVKAADIMAHQNVFAKEVHVKLPPFPDYVFGENYYLRPLSEVKSFIETHQHLPGYPSAEEIKKEGIGVGELQVKQMETIEELMLYVIELEEKVKKLEEKIQNLKVSN